MSIALALLAGATVFLAGFFVGLNPPSKSIAARRDRNDIERMISETAEEYKNFLNYDGSVQN